MNPAVNPDLRLRLSPSRGLLLFLLAAHGGALAGLWMAALPGVAAVALSLAVLAGLAASVRRHALLRSPGAVVGLAWRESLGWELETRDGRRLAASLGPGAYVHPLLVVLGLRVPGERFRRTVVVAADAVAAQSHRRLRAHLRRGEGLSGDGREDS